MLSLSLFPPFITVSLFESQSRSPAQEEERMARFRDFYITGFQKPVMKKISKSNHTWTQATRLNLLTPLPIPHTAADVSGLSLFKISTTDYLVLTPSSVAAPNSTTLDR